MTGESRRGKKPVKEKKPQSPGHRFAQRGTEIYWYITRNHRQVDPVITGDPLEGVREMPSQSALSAKLSNQVS